MNLIINKVVFYISIISWGIMLIFFSPMLFGAGGYVLMSIAHPAWKFGEILMASYFYAGVGGGIGYRVFISLYMLFKKKYLEGVKDDRN